MNKTWKVVVVVALIAVVVVLIAIKQSNKTDSEIAVSENPIGPPAQPAETEKADESKALPRLIDLGAGKCIPCKMMAPILEELKKEYAGRFRVDFFDVWKDPDIAREYRIRVIPTQIFFDASGKELSRHEGFMSKEDILGKWKELGVELTKPK